MGLPSAEPMPSNSKNVAKKESDQIEDYFVLDMRNIQSCVATYLKITKNLCNSKIKPTYLEDFKCCKLWCLILSLETLFTESKNGCFLAKLLGTPLNLFCLNKMGYFLQIHSINFIHMPQVNEGEHLNLEAGKN